MPNLVQHAKRLIEPVHDDLIELARHLVQTPSVNIPPHGTETPAQEVLHEFLTTHSVATELYAVDRLLSSGHPYVRADRVYDDRTNLSASVRGNGRGRSLLLNGHIDTVPPGKGKWKHLPWSGELRDGKLYGLGSFDMKGGLAAQAGVLAAIAKSGISLSGDLLFESVIDEEWGGGGGTLAALLRGVRADAAVISEGTQLQVLRATRGGFVVDLEVQAGDPSAYFSQERVISPAVPIGHLLQWVDSWTELRASIKTSGAYADVPDPAPVQVLAIEANRLDPDIPLSVPLKGTVRVYFQFLPEEDVPQVLREIRTSLNAFAAADPFFRDHPIEWKPLYDPPLLGHELPLTHPWTQCVSSAVEHVCATKLTVGAAPYPCDAFLLQHEFNIPTLLFGPRGAGAHNPDEYVEADSIVSASECLLAAALDWCG